METMGTPAKEEYEQWQAGAPGVLEFGFLHCRKMNETLFPALRAFFAGRQGLRVLDLGCGTGRYADGFSRHIGALVRLDIVPGAGAEVVGCGEALPFKDESFDAILCIQVLEHARQPFELVESARRTLKRGGKIFLSTHGIWVHHPAPQDRWRFEPDGFQELFKRYSAVQIIPQGGALLACMQVINLWIKAWRRPPFIPQRLWPYLKAPLYVLPNILGLLDGGGNARLVQNYLVIGQK